jgi:hypothetical protein
MTMRISRLSDLPARCLLRRPSPATLLSGGLALPASAAVQDRLPDVRLGLQPTSASTARLGRQALVERVQAVASGSLRALSASLIVPYGRRLQPRYCVTAVRGEILRAMPRAGARRPMMKVGAGPAAD